MNKAAHLRWCKARALEYVNKGDLRGGWESFVLDMRKHPHTKSHLAIYFGILIIRRGKLSTPKEMKEFIEGIH